MYSPDDDDYRICDIPITRIGNSPPTRALLVRGKNERTGLALYILSDDMTVNEEHYMGTKMAKVIGYVKEDDKDRFIQIAKETTVPTIPKSKYANPVDVFNAWKCDVIATARLSNCFENWWRAG